MHVTTEEMEGFEEFEGKWLVGMKSEVGSDQIEGLRAR